MGDLARKVLEAGNHIDPVWDEDQVESSLVRTHARIRRGRIARGGLGIGVPLVILAGLIYLGSTGMLRTPSTPAPAIIATNPGVDPGGPSAGTMLFADGSRATPLSDDSAVVADDVSSTGIAVRLERGSARFEVTPRPERLFQVHAGPVTVLVLGTVFTVTRLDGRVAVEVERGRVRVSWEEEARVIETGERGLFPPVHEIPPPSATEPDQAEPPPTLSPRAEAHGASRRPDAGASPRTAGWQELAEQGRFDDAWAAMQASGSEPRSMEELLLAADVARLSGHSSDAVRWLERAMEHHPGDPRASVAAFTLGRVLLNQVGRPREAAEAFARARRLSPSGALAEDALAREVEAWSRAGVSVRARERAERYIERYPQGRRLRAVRRFGGLEE